MFMPRVKGGGMLAQMITASPKAQNILTIHFLEKTFI